jgi:phosphopantothenoylcysteine synthetase/decarboxylase
VLNDVAQPGIGFDSEDNEVVILTRAGDHAVPRGPKSSIAVAILDRVESLRTAKEVTL